MESTNNQYSFNKLSESFQSLIVNPDLTFQLFDMFPIPIEIFSPDGTSVYLNKAILELNNIPDANLVVGKYNLVNDTVCNDQLGGRDMIQRAFRGESVVWANFPTPIQDLVDRGIIEEKLFESAFMDAYLFPVWNGDQLAYVVNVFVIKHMYQGKTEIAKAKEYMDSHWLDEFDPDAVAKYVNLSPAHLRALFKQHAGVTMRDYYKKVKVEHFKEKLADRNLSIAEVFNACGENSRGAFVRTFKDLTGMTATEFRNSLK